MSFPPEVVDNIKSAILQHSGHSVLPLQAERWEEIVVNAFKKQGYHPGWDPGSHKSGVDITLPLLGMSVSCKSAKVEGKRVKRLNFSSFRTTTLETLEEKIEFFDGDGKNFSHYLIIARDGCDRFRKYTVWLIDANHIKASDFDWEESKSGWKTKERYGFKMYVQKKMSHQFWVSMDLRYLQNHAKHKPHEVRVLFEVILDRRELGKTHEITELGNDKPKEFSVEAEEYNADEEIWTTLVTSKERLK